MAQTTMRLDEMGNVGKFKVRQEVQWFAVLGRATARSPGLPVKFPGPTSDGRALQGCKFQDNDEFDSGRARALQWNLLGTMVITLIFPSSSSEMALVVWRRLIDTVHGVAKVANCAQLR